MPGTDTGRGAEGFIASLAVHGITAVVDGPAVLYDLAAVSGKLAGQTVRTGVSVSELEPWPVGAPHWIHFPENITLTPTNVDVNGCLPGWKRHSRNMEHWEAAPDPGGAWLGHVRGVIADAT